MGVAAHTGGFSSMVGEGDFVACCGFSMRAGRVVADAYLKVRAFFCVLERERESE